MSDDIDFNTLADLIRRSRKLKKEASQMHAEALLLDERIRESLAKLREKSGPSAESYVKALAADPGATMNIPHQPDKI
jgi:hypothetical protein